jgi:integrase
MNTVEPIRDYELIEAILDYLKKWDERNYIMFCIGIYAPMRISDILRLKVVDVRNKTYISKREKKTGKEQMIPINPILKKILDDYIYELSDHDYLVPSRQCNRNGYYGPISRQQAYNVMTKIAKEFNLEKIGCHTLRKTFGFHYYQQTKDIGILQDIFKHSDVSITKRYIGLTQEMKNDAIKNFRYKKKR